MESLELLILDMCFQYFQSAEYSIDSEDLVEKMVKISCQPETEIYPRIESLWEQNYLESSNGRYYLTDNALELLKKLKQPRN